MWKGRKELPSLRKLDMIIDIDRLIYDFEKIKDRPWDAYEKEFKDLNIAWTSISKNIDNKIQLMALTEFDEEYEIRKDRNSGSKWDIVFMKNDKRADARAYNKIKKDLPSYLREVMGYFEPEISRTILSNIKSHHSIQKHIDHDSLLSVRYHIALKTNDHSFLCYEKNGETIKVHIPADGHVWFLNPGLPHWAENNGDTDRIHLIINMDSQRMINES